MRYLPAVSPLDALQRKVSVYIYSNMSCTCTYSYYPVTLYEHMLQNKIMAYFFDRSHGLVSILRYMCNNQTTPTLQKTKISHLGKSKIIDSTADSSQVIAPHPASQLAEGPARCVAETDAPSRPPESPGGVVRWVRNVE